jgi:hypothetical protein
MGNVNDANLLGKLAFSFNIIAAVAWIVYVVAISVDGFEQPNHEWCKYAYWIGLIAGVLFSIGGFLCGMLNRSNLVSGQSRGNWNNAFFYAGLSLFGIGICTFGYLFFIGKSNPAERTLIRFAAAIVVLMSGCWLLSEPDLLPTDCVKD